MGPLEASTLRRFRFSEREYQSFQMLLVAASHAQSPGGSKSWGERFSAKVPPYLAMAVPCLLGPSPALRASSIILCMPCRDGPAGRLLCYTALLWLGAACLAVCAVCSAYRSDLLLNSAVVMQWVPRKLAAGVDKLHKSGALGHGAKVADRIAGAIRLHLSKEHLVSVE